MQRYGLLVVCAAASAWLAGWSAPRCWAQLPRNVENVSIDGTLADFTRAWGGEPEPHESGVRDLQVLTVASATPDSVITLRRAWFDNGRCYGIEINYHESLAIARQMRMFVDMITQFGVQTATSMNDDGTKNHRLIDKRTLWSVTVHPAPSQPSAVKLYVADNARMLKALEKIQRKDRQANDARNRRRR